MGKSKNLRHFRYVLVIVGVLNVFYTEKESMQQDWPRTVKRLQTISWDCTLILEYFNFFLNVQNETVET